MEIREYLRDKGIIWKEARRPTGLWAIMPCPSCGNREKFGINLDTGGYKCFRSNECGIQGNFWKFQELMGDKPKYFNPNKNYFHKMPEKTYEKPVEKFDDLNEIGEDFLKSRGITAETCSHFKVKSSGTEIAFPYFYNGDHIFTKYRDTIEKKFRRDKGTKPILYNMDSCIKTDLIICEGELDAMAAREYGIDAVSVPSGTADLTWIETCWDYLERFQKVYLCLDADEAGQTAVDVIANRLGKWRCYSVTLPYKDMNECLMEGVTEEQIWECIIKAQDYNHPSLRDARMFSSDIKELRNRKEKLFGVSTKWVGLDECLRGWREAEVTIWTGNSGSGKTNILNEVMLNLIEQGERCCVASMEMSPVNLLNWMIMQRTMKSDITDDDIDTTLNFLTGFLYVAMIWGEVSKDKLLEIFMFAARKHGVKHFVIDSMMKVSMYGNNELQKQKEFVNSIVDFAKQFDAHVHLVAHPRKPGEENKKPNKHDISGSGDITNLAHNVLAMWRPDQKQRDKEEILWDNAIHVLKNREWGSEGEVAFTFIEDCKKFKEV